MRVLKAILVVFALMTFIFPATHVLAQTPEPNEIFVSQTGHYVKGGFLKVYHSVSDYETIFGYPLTDEIIDPTNGRTVQYFQRARFDLISDSKGLHVEIAPLGQLLYESGGESRPDLSTSNKCRLFEKTGKKVCLAFLDFYDAHQGQIYFGQPITEIEIREGLYVQYFEKVRLEWHPERESGQRVVLTDLGRIYFDTRVGDPVLLEPAPANNLIGEQTKINVKAFVNKALVSNNETETIFVIVRDQYLNPIQSAGVTVVITRTDGQKERYRPPVTNFDGISKLELSVNNMPLLSIVSIQVIANYQDMQTSSTTWFRVW
jgi:hypothetical protein